MTESTVLHNELFNQLYETFKKHTSYIDRSIDNFMDFLVKAMEDAEHLCDSLEDRQKIHGLEKKELVKSVLHKFLTDLDQWSDKQKNKITGIVTELELFSDKAIDILVAAAKGQLHFNEAVKLVKQTSCFAKPNPVQKVSHVPKDISDMQILIDTIYDEVKGSIVNKQFGISNVMVLVAIAMQVAEKNKTLNGPEKKEIVLKVLKRLILEIPMSDRDRMMMDSIIEVALGKAIDYIIMAANGELDFGKMIENAKKTFKTMFSCCFKKEVPSTHPVVPVPSNVPATTSVPAPVSAVTPVPSVVEPTPAVVESPPLIVPSEQTTTPVESN
jgi:hypothetical protein